MDRSIFRRPSRDTSPLLPQHNSPYSHPMMNLAPRPYSDTPTSKSAQSQASNSPTSPEFPSRFHDSHAPTSQPRSTPSPSRSRRARGVGHVQFEQIPPPIASSVLLRSSHAPTAASAYQSRAQTRSLSSSRTLATPAHGPPNPLTALLRREKSIQANLQVLLDAQSTGLVQGRTGQDFNLGSDTGSSTPTSQSAFLNDDRGNERAQSRDGRPAPVVPVRQPRKKAITLRAARRGILAAMEELGSVKTQEEDTVETSISTLRSVLSQVEDWNLKIEEFGSEMAKIQGGSENREVAELQNEKAAVEMEIREVEERLFALRARNRQLGAGIEELENRREAKISSFREGRRGVDMEVKSFLNRPPVEVISAVTTFADEGKGKEVEQDEMGAMFQTLPPKRRTLDMAKSWLTVSISKLSSRKSSIQKEKAALDEGAAMWEGSIDLVADFENDLREQMRSGAPSSGTDTLKSQIEKMGSVIEELETRVNHAESQGWNLLICAIGAEAEAFKEGREILRGVLGTLEPAASGQGKSDELISQSEDEQAKPVHENINGGSHNDLDELGQSNITIEELRNGHASEQVARHPPSMERFDTAKEAAEYRSESEDDGPHPDLLVSQDDEDDEEPHPDLLVSQGVDAL